MNPIIFNGDDDIATFVNESILTIQVHTGKAFGKFINPIIFNGDDDIATFVNESPFIPFFIQCYRD